LDVTITLSGVTSGEIITKVIYTGQITEIMKEDDFAILNNNENLIFTEIT
jgi:hypothetical protein